MDYKEPEREGESVSLAHTLMGSVASAAFIDDIMQRHPDFGKVYLNLLLRGFELNPCPHDYVTQYGEVGASKLRASGRDEDLVTVYGNKEIADNQIDGSTLSSRLFLTITCKRIDQRLDSETELQIGPRTKSPIYVVIKHQNPPEKRGGTTFPVEYMEFSSLTAMIEDPTIRSCLEPRNLKIEGTLPAVPADVEAT